MTPEEILRAALAEATAHARPAPGALERLRGRAHRRKRVERVRTAGGLAAASLLLVATPFALRGGDPSEPPPLATESPSPDPAPTATPSPLPSAEPSPLAAGPAEFVAVTADRRLLLVSSETGAVTREITRLPAMPWSVELSPDGRTVYTDTFPPYNPELSGSTPPEQCPAIHAVDVATGARRFVARGKSPRLSPAGSRLAFVACPQAAVRILDGATYLDEYEYGGLGSVAWSPDGTALYVQAAGDDSNSMCRLDLAKDRTIGDCEIVHDRPMYGLTLVPWRDDQLLYAESSAIERRDGFAIEVSDQVENGYAANFRTLFEVPGTADYNDPVVDALVVGPAGEILVQTRDLYVWRGSGAPARLGRAYPLIGW